MLFGLTFKCDGETAQIRVTDSMRLEFRVTKGGEWQAWKRADVERGADGSLAEAVMECVTARQAQKFRTPMKITFSGDVTGAVTFDGSGDVSCPLSTSAAINAALSAAIDEHVRTYHRKSS